MVKAVFLGSVNQAHIVEHHAQALKVKTIVSLEG